MASTSDKALLDAIFSALIEKQHRYLAHRRACPLARCDECDLVTAEWKYAKREYLKVVREVIG